MLKSIFARVALLFVLLSCSNEKKMGLLWSDEFNTGEMPNADDWIYDIGDGCPQSCGWGNNELQYYTKANKRNTRIEKGSLIIEVHKEVKGEKKYTSTRLLTRGKRAWQYGRFVVRARLPNGIGTWPAIWMLPEDWEGKSWPAAGEIDIMEHVGFDQGNVHGTIHTKSFNGSMGTQKSGQLVIEDLSDSFHEYSLQWGPDKMEWFIDDQIYFTYMKNNMGVEGWPFDKKFHLILNVAVGGDWGGRMGVDDTIWPQRMEIDYVRVYSN